MGSEIEAQAPDAPSAPGPMKGGAAPRLWRHGLIYAGGDLATRGLAFLLIPLYTHYLDPAD